MLNKKNIYLILLLLLPLTLSACSSSNNKIGKCNLRDNRFSCQGFLDTDGKGYLEFSKFPSSGNFKIISYDLQKLDENGDSMPYRDCSGSLGNINKNKTFTFDCQPLKPGTYYVKFEIEHYETKNYKPQSNEVCVLLNKAGTKNLKCTTGGEFKYIIKNAP